MRLVIREFGDFYKDAIELLGQESYEELVSYLSMNPTAGAVIAGSGGFRKLRWARKGMGKSGGARTVYFYRDSDSPLNLIAIYGKNQKENLTKEEVNELKQLSIWLKG